MYLVLQIAFGIVLAWLIITRFDSIKNVILFPFRMLWSLAKAIGGIAYEMVYGISVTAGKILLYGIPIAFVVAIVGGIGYGLFNLLPAEHFQTIFFSIIVFGIITAIATIAKDFYESYKEKNSYFWMFLSVFIFFGVLATVSTVFFK
jgi:hypothetical protein